MTTFHDQGETYHPLLTLPLLPSVHCHCWEGKKGKPARAERKLIEGNTWREHKRFSSFNAYGKDKEIIGLGIKSAAQKVICFPFLFDSFDLHPAAKKNVWWNCKKPCLFSSHASKEDSKAKASADLLFPFSWLLTFLRSAWHADQK